MNKIGFKNFRRFLDFEPIEYSDITFLVGRNNSGKSTLVKAILLIDGFFKSNQLKKFSFGNNVLEDANIVTYDRARNQFAEENLIQFSYAFDSFLVTIIISSEEQKTDADVHLFSIKDTKNQYEFVIEPQLESISFKRSKTENDHIGNTLVNLMNEIQRLEEYVKSTELKKSSRDFIEANDKLQALKTKRNLIVHHRNSDDELDMVNEPATEYNSYIESQDDFEYSMSFYCPEEETLTGLIDELFRSNEVIHHKEFKEIQGGAEANKDFKNYRAFHIDRTNIRDSFERFKKLIAQASYYYLGANLTKQSALFAIRDRKNPLAQAIHDFNQLSIPKGERTYAFLKKWMKIFEVGDSFEINIYGGEAYEVIVFSNNARIQLADKGMGSIQAMLLLFRLAYIIYKTKKENYRPIVLIEEPELNLHPALQSKLADLFLEVHKQHGVDFILETHSEYILRRSQVIVAEGSYAGELGENPFCVFYFPKDLKEKPYRLNYNNDGTFDKDFGLGFFDEASKSTMQILRLRRQKRKND